MPGTPLELISSELADQFDQATDQERRAVSLWLCEVAVTRLGLNDPLVERALLLLEHGIYHAEGLSTDLQRLIANLEQQYVDARTRYRARNCDEDTVLTLFGRCRAVSAVCFALNDDPFFAAGHSISESCMALQDDDLPLCMLQHLRSQKSGLVQGMTRRDPCRPTSRQEYDELPRGAFYIHPSGVMKIKTAVQKKK